MLTSKGPVHACPASNPSTASNNDCVGAADRPFNVTTANEAFTFHPGGMMGVMVGGST